MVESVAVLSETTLLVRYAGDDWDDHDLRKQFDLECLGVRDHELGAGFSDGIQWVEDHPVLWPFSSEPCHLYFTSRPVDAFAVVGRLYEAHERLYEGWKNLRDHINSYFRPNLHDLLDGGNGLLADGPRVALEGYAAALEGLIDVQITTFARAGHGAKPAVRALLFDAGYVVCEGVTVREVERSG